VARAARDVGNRIGFAIAMRDCHGIAYCDDATALAALRPEIRDAVAARLITKPLLPAQQLALVEEVARMVEEESYAEHVTVQYGPTGVQWCSRGCSKRSRRHRPTTTGRSTCISRDALPAGMADQTHPEGIVRYLDDLGMLSPRLTLAHCVWARPEELSLLAERGVTIA